MRYDTITFVSDYGSSDEFVGVVHSVIRSLAPDVRVIDLTHEIPPYDTRAAALLLARSVQYLAPGVVLAVVDPGVGTDRRGVAIEVGDGQAVLVGPDNGVLAPAVSLVGGADRAVVLTNPDYQLPAPGATFAGRDVFAPAAAHLCAGVPLEALGEPVDPAGLLPGVVPLTREVEDGLAAEVLWVDRYGNAQLNVDPDEIRSWGDRIRVRAGDNARVARRVQAFAELRPGELGLVTDSYGLLALAVDRGSAAVEAGVGPGEQVVLQPIDDDDEPRHVTTPVRIGSKPTR